MSPPHERSTAGPDPAVEAFEQHRAHLRAVAHRMLGSSAAAEDAVQETWIRFSGARTEDVRDQRAWLTMVVSRVCLNVLRARRRRPEEPAGAHVPDPIVGAVPDAHPEDEAVLADAVGVALLVVLEQLSPAERLAFVLHDVFAVPFDEIAPLVERTPEATRQLASRARRRVQATPASSAADLARQRVVVDAFFAAARRGDLEGLVAVLHPDVDLRADAGGRPATARVRGAAAVAGRAVMFANPVATLVPAVVDGSAGVVVAVDGRAVAVMGFTVVDGLITAVTALSDPDRVARLDLSAVLEGRG